MRVVNTDAPFYLSKPPENFLETTEKEKNRNYPDACLKQRRCFTPSVASVDNILGVEAEATIKRITRRLTTKWKDTYSCNYEYVKSRVSITLVRSTHRCIQGPGLRPPK